jgi:hypothetical protein
MTENILSRTRVERDLAKLTDDELRNFFLWADYAQRTGCVDKPWFGKVKHLFTECSGQRINPVVFETIGQIVLGRLRPLGFSTFLQ